MAIKPPPPPTKSEPGSFAWMDWYRSLYDFITTAGAISWSQINFAGSNLADLATRLHSSLQSILGTGAYHISATEATDVTNLSNGVITDVNYITFDTTPTGVPTTTAGTLFYDSADGNQTLSMVMANGVTTQQIGEEQYTRIKATSAITEGQVVMFTGSVGASGALTGAPATGLTPTTALYVIGVATENIALNGWGYITTYGLVRGLDTTGGAEAWVDGQLLYLDPTIAGKLTKTLPVAPNPKVVMAAVVHASASVGSMFIRPSFGGRLGDFEGDVNISSLADGEILQYSGTNSRWENVPFPGSTSLEGSFTPTVFGTSVAGTGTYTAAAGAYTKIGRQVFFTINLAWTAHTGTGNVEIAGLPYTAAATFNSAVSLYHNTLTLTAGYTLQAYIPASTTKIVLEQVATGGSSSIPVPMDTSVSYFMINGSYFV